MDSNAALAEPQPRPMERRRHQRVKINVLGRYMLSNQAEYPCQVRDMSPGGAALIAPVSGRVGERVVAYIDHIGRVEGIIARVFPEGFAIQFHATLRKRDKLAAQLTWLANRHTLNLPEDRRHERVEPRERETRLVLTDGRSYPCEIMDMSLSGAAVRIGVAPAIGSLVTIGRMRARVVRHFANGVALEFSQVQNEASLERNIRP